MIYIKENSVTVEDTADGSVSISAEFPGFTAWLEPNEAEILLRGLLRWKHDGLKQEQYYDGLVAEQIRTLLVLMHEASK